MATYTVNGDNVASYENLAQKAGQLFEKQFSKKVNFITIRDVDNHVSFWVNGEYPYSLENGKIISPKNY